MAKKKPVKRSTAAAKSPVSTAVAAEETPITTAIGRDANGNWTVDVAIVHGDQTVVRVNGRAVWQGTP